MILGISGYARAGKDTIGKILVDAFGFERRAFADKLRECLYALNPNLGHDQLELAPLVDKYGWEVVKQYPEVRRLLQRLGTEVGRNLLGADVWVNTVMAEIAKGPENKNWVITDLRYPNEARALARAGGQIWRVNRPGVEPTNAHISETALDQWQFDHIFDNYSDVDHLALEVDRVVNLVRL